MTELTDLSETDDDNTPISGTNIAEGCAPSGINNAIRKTLGLIRRAFKTSIFRLRDSTDQTKLLALDLSGLTTATTRTLKVPDADGVLALSSDVKGYLYGLTLTNNATDAPNDIDIAPGNAVDLTGAQSLVLASTLTKRLDASWAVGNNQGGLDTGAVGNSTYYVWLIKRVDTNVVDVLFSLSNTAPTMPASYTLKQLIGSFARASAANNYPRSFSAEDSSAWVAYTPTFTNFGSVTNIGFWSRRVGDTLQIRGKFTTGTTVAGEAQVTLGFNGGNSNVISDVVKVPSIQLAGAAVLSIAAATSTYTLTEGGVGYFAFGFQSASNAGLTKLNGTNLGSGTIISIMVEVPIAGW